MKILKVILYLFILSLFLHSEEITIVTEEFPPYNYQVDGKMKGISSEIVLAVLKEINVTAKIVSYHWSRAYVLASTKKNHLIYSIARIPEREELFHWIGTIAPYSTSFYKLKSRKDIKINSLDDAKKYTIG
ncbi:MAG: transporter substrate-binding domain-containing protein, partial [Campylobacteraceae bacterium]|nr:transporter substrate-binding domain-containing protein [Campylobacteraceae bacterium]